MIPLGKIGRSFFPFLAGILTASAIITVTWFVGILEQLERAQEERLRALYQMSTVRARLEGTLSAKILLLRSIVSYISVRGEIDRETFQTFASGLLAGDSLIRNVTLLKGTVIVDVYPLKGQERALGVDLALVKDQRQTLQKAIDTREPIIAGPLELVQGGAGIVSRIPIFLTPQGKTLGEGAYWGQTSVVIIQENLFQQAGLTDPSPGLRYALRGKDGLGAKGEIFWGDETVFQSNPITMDVTLPGGSWQMAAVPTTGWNSGSGTLFWIHASGGFLSLFAGWVTWSLLMAKERLKKQLAIQGTLVEKARESEKKYKELFDNSTDLIYTHDLRGNCTSVNAAVMKVLGYTIEEAMNLNVRQIIHPDYLSALPDEFQKKLDKVVEISGPYEIVAKTKDGHPVWLEITNRLIEKENRVVGVHGTARDITARKEAEVERSLLVTAVEQAGDIIVVTDPSGNILYVNPAFESTTGYTSEEVAGNNPRILKSGIQDKSFYNEMWITISEGKIWRGRFSNRRKDGTLYEETASISPIKDSMGRIINYVAVKRDITADLILQKQLMQAQKMESIGTLAGGIAHDFNNLLQVILGHTDLLLMDKEIGHIHRHKLEIVRRAAQDGADLVSRILTFSRRAETKTRTIDLNEEIRRIEKLMRRIMPKMIEIKLTLADDLRIIDADPAQIEQLLLNLAVNAQHAMPDGGDFLIETSNVPLRDEFLRTQSGVTAGRYVRLTVSDTGVGIPPELQERIFDPFFTTKVDGEGTGLGLAMVHGIVSQHAGYIGYYSEPGIGTSFKIYLPVSTANLSRQSAEKREVPAFGNETILLVDDDARIRDLVSEMLELGGYSVVQSCSGEEALEKYTADRNSISAVILDFIMPGIGGKKCLEELLRIDPKVKVIVASGFSHDDMTTDKTLGGAKAFIRKPYDARDILSAIRTVLNGGDI